MRKRRSNMSVIRDRDRTVKGLSKEGPRQAHKGRYRIVREAPAWFSDLKLEYQTAKRSGLSRRNVMFVSSVRTGMVGLVSNSLISSFVL